MRKIHNPNKGMRILQYRILTKILDQVPIPDYIYGFEKGKSIPKMAEAHVGKELVISLDIKDFFPSIKEYMVEEIFKSIGANETAARVLAEACTYKYYVPQGSITAPKISNIIAAGTFGPEVKKLCDSLGLTLTIYADDITISHDKTFESLEEAKRFTTLVINETQKIVRSYGFYINQAKTKVMRPHNRQWVCGAVVNEKVNLRKKERLQLRAIIHNCKKNGIEAEAAKTNISPEAFIRKYAGRINWMTQLNPDAGLEMKLAFKKITTPYLKKHPEVEIPELSWNSSIELPATAQDFKDAEAGFITEENKSDFQMPMLKETNASLSAGNITP
jgi:RNA-directed DNA polymerase